MSSSEAISDSRDNIEEKPEEVRIDKLRLLVQTRISNIPVSRTISGKILRVERAFDIPWACIRCTTKDPTT